MVGCDGAKLKEGCEFVKTSMQPCAPMARYVWLNKVEMIGVIRKPGLTLAGASFFDQPPVIFLVNQGSNINRILLLVYMIKLLS